MKDSGLPWIGDIPEHWDTMPNKYIMYKVKEIQNKYKGEDIISLSVDGVKVRDLEAGGKMPTSFDGYQKIKPNRLLMCLFDMDVTPRCIGIINDEGLTSPAYSQFAMTPNAYAPYFYYYYLSLDYDKTLVHLAKNLRHSLTEDQLGAIGVVVPPLSEQQSIADYLDTKTAEIDAAITTAKELIDKYKAYKQSVITEAVTKGLNHEAKMKDSGIEWVGEIPKHWIACRFKTKAQVKANLVNPDNYPDLPQIAPDCIEKGSGKIIKSQMVKEACVISDNHLFHQGQILYSKIRPTLNKVTIAPYDGLCCADMYPIETTLDVKFCLYQMMSSIFCGQVGVVVQDRVKMPKINKEEMGQIRIIVPPLSEQQSIADYLDDKCSQIDTVIAQKEQLVRQLQEYKKSIIYEYVTGKKEVQNG